MTFRVSFGPKYSGRKRCALTMSRGLEMDNKYSIQGETTNAVEAQQTKEKREHRIATDTSEVQKGSYSKRKWGRKVIHKCHTVRPDMIHGDIAQNTNSRTSRLTCRRSRARYMTDTRVKCGSEKAGIELRHRHNKRRAL